MNPLDRPSLPDAIEDAHSGDVRPIESDVLLGRDGEVAIRHEGRLYLLRRTRSGKLILTA